MKHTPPSKGTFQSTIRRTIARITLGVILASAPASAIAASSWNPTLLVNTEAFHTIDEGDGSTNIEVRFGQTLLETITFNRTSGRFEFSDDVTVRGNLSGSTLRVDNNTDLWGTLAVSGATVIKGNTKVRANLSGSSLTVDGHASVTGSLLVKGNIKGKANISGSTLWIDGLATFRNALTVTGAITTNSNITINSDRTASADATLTFGNETANKTLIFSHSNQRFQFDDDVYTSAGLEVDGTTQLDGTTNINGVTTVANTLTVTGNTKVRANLSGSSLTVDGHATVTGSVFVKGNIKGKSNISGSTLTVDGNTTLHGLTYAFPTSQTANTFLKTDGSGNLSWAATTVGNGSGDLIAMSPEYPNAVYFASGSSAVGQLSYSYDSTNKENYYRWQSTKTANQNYWISTRIRVPDNFSSWDPVKPIEFRYRASGGYLDVYLRDTAGAIVTLTSGTALKGASWATANITGPQSAGTFTPKSYMTVFVRATASGAGVLDEFADAGFMNLNFETTTP